MRITTWNVNSIRRRLDGVLRWLERERPDILCLQETKCADDVFQWISFKGLAYELSYIGQRTYNGVAIVSLAPQIDIHPVWDQDPGRRSIAATIDGIWIVNVYVPYGEKGGAQKFRKKLRWLDCLQTMLVAANHARMIVSSDFNVAPDDRDVYDPRIRRETLMCSTPEREGFRALLETGFVDALREYTSQSGTYTW